MADSCSRKEHYVLLIGSNQLDVVPLGHERTQTFYRCLIRREITDEVELHGCIQYAF